LRVITQDGNIIEATMRYVTLDGNIIEGATRHVTIEWEGPFTIEHVLTLTDKKDYGLYQIYDRDKLLYIGKAEEISFSARLENHEILRKVEDKDAEIRIGRIAVGDYEDEPENDRWTDWRRLLQDVEALQIFTHKPPKNRDHTRTYKGPPLYVVNKGDIGNLDKIVTSNNLDTH
jgi:hypothetical protein